MFVREERQRKGNSVLYDERKGSALRCYFLICRCFLDAEPGGGILDKDMAQSNVAAKHFDRFVPGLFHHDKFTDSVHCGLRDATSPEGVTCEEFGLHSGAGYGSFQNGANRILKETALGHAPMAIDSAEDGSILDACCPDPYPQGSNRASFHMLAEGDSNVAARTLLIGLRYWHVDDYTVFPKGELANLNPRKFGSPEAAGEADQSERPVAQTKQIGRRSFHDPANVRGKKRIFSFLCGTERSPDSF